MATYKPGNKNVWISDHELSRGSVNKTKQSNSQRSKDQKKKKAERKEEKGIPPLSTPRTRPEDDRGPLTLKKTPPPPQKTPGKGGKAQRKEERPGERRKSVYVYETYQPHCQQTKKETKRGRKKIYSPKALVGRQVSKCNYSPEGLLRTVSKASTQR